MELWTIFKKRRLIGLKTFEQEQNELLKFILNERYFKVWQNNKNISTETELNRSLANNSNLELFITPTCNQHCEYCYLVKYENELYPHDINNQSNILHNIDIFLNWCIEQQFYIPSIDLFTGEIWHTQFGLNVLELIYQKILKGLQASVITIPSNCSFLLDKEQTFKIQHYIDLFAKYNITLQFSISVDGAIIEQQSRPLNNNVVKSDEFYENMFLFAQHNNFYFHPMVSAKNVKYWIENYKWWEMMHKKYNYLSARETLMMLEVRNADWTDEAIQDYKNFIDFLMTDVYNMVNQDSKELTQIVLNAKDYPITSSYLPWNLNFMTTFMGCSSSNTLTIRAGDLAICPCHRTSYNKFLYGKFIVDNDKIVDIEANNVQAAIRMLLSNNNLCSFRCDTCPINPICIKGCFGSQLENTGDPFMPVPNVCHFFEEKYKFLIQEYRKFGIIDCLEEISVYNPTFLTMHSLLKTIYKLEDYYGLGTK